MDGREWQTLSQETAESWIQNNLVKDFILSKRLTNMAQMPPLNNEPDREAVKNKVLIKISSHLNFMLSTSHCQKCKVASVPVDSM